MKLLLWIRQLKKWNWYRNPSKKKYHTILVMRDLKDHKYFNVGVFDCIVTAVNRTTGEVYIDFS